MKCTFVVEDLSNGSLDCWFTGGKNHDIITKRPLSWHVEKHTAVLIIRTSRRTCARCVSCLKVMSQGLTVIRMWIKSFIRWKPFISNFLPLNSPPWLEPIYFSLRRSPHSSALMNMEIWRCCINRNLLGHPSPPLPALQEEEKKKGKAGFRSPLRMCESSCDVVWRTEQSHTDLWLTLEDPRPPLTSFSSPCGISWRRRDSKCSHFELSFWVVQSVILLILK